MPSREHYDLSAQSLQELVTKLQFAFSRVQDRLDKIEGVRGTASITDALEIKADGEIVHGFNTNDEI